MSLRIVIAVGLLAIAISVAGAQTTTRRFVILDATGKRGVVLFDHQRHERFLNASPDNPHQSRGISCIGCHHTVKNLAQSGAFQKCTECHKSEGNPQNPDDRQGFDLNAREIFHRNCVGCHQANAFKASNEWFQTTGFVRCNECHLSITASPVLQTQLPPETSTNSPPGSLSETKFDFLPVPDRWRIEKDRKKKENPLFSPYAQNPWKGDYPLIGDDIFLNITAESNSLTNFRNLPVASDVSSQRPESSEFFGKGRQFYFRPNTFVSFDLQKGDTAYRPPDWRFLVAPNFNVNYLNSQENGIVNIDVNEGENRTDGYVSLQEAFGEIRIADTTRLLPFLDQKRADGQSPFYDSTSLRAGLQPIVTDFRGFVFRDTNLGIRVFGNYASNRYQFNGAVFPMLEKDTNSELNTLDWRHQMIYAVNVFRQDTHWKGYTSLFSFHFNDDHASRHFDDNGFLVRPALLGIARPHHIQAAYLGWSGEGHVGWLNVSHAFYQVLGTDDANPVAGHNIHINAQMAAVETSIDHDWLRWKSSVFWASGDSDPHDSSGRGFDSILDAPDFSGGIFSFWNSQEIKLAQTNVNLVNTDSLLPNLRSSKIEGQANYVNPGILILDFGIEGDLTHKIKLFAQINYLLFHHTESLETVLFQPDIRRSIGIDYGAGVLFRPLLSENAVVVAGFSSLIPGNGYRDIFSSNCSEQGCGADADTLYSYFIRVKLTY